MSFASPVQPQTDECLELFTIYQHPRDYPENFVVRRWLVLPDGSGRIATVAAPHAVVDTLEEARQSLPPFLVKSYRYPEDDPVIVETWL